MKRISITLAFLLILSSTLVSAQATAPDAIQIVKKSIEAMGGEAVLKNVKTLYSNMSTEMEGRKVNWIVREMLPNKGSFQVVYQGRTVYQTWFDGNDGYETNGGIVEKSDPKSFEDKAYKQNIFNELDYLNPELWTLERLEDDKVGNAECYKVKGVLKNGLVEIFYFDKSTYLMLRSDKLENANKDSFTTVLYMKFKKYGPLTYCSEERLGDEGNFKTVILEELIINKKVTTGDFVPLQK